MKAKALKNIKNPALKLILFMSTLLLTAATISACSGWDTEEIGHYGPNEVLDAKNPEKIHLEQSYLAGTFRVSKIKCWAGRPTAALKKLNADMDRGLMKVSLAFSPSSYTQTLESNARNTRKILNYKFVDASLNKFEQRYESAECMAKGDTGDCTSQSGVPGELTQVQWGFNGDLFEMAHYDIHNEFCEGTNARRGYEAKRSQEFQSSFLSIPK